MQHQQQAATAKGSQQQVPMQQPQVLQARMGPSPAQPLAGHLGGVLLRAPVNILQQVRQMQPQ
jgi:hypothetical protein